MPLRYEETPASAGMFCKHCDTLLVAIQHEDNRIDYENPQRRASWQLYLCASGCGTYWGVLHKWDIQKGHTEVWEDKGANLAYVSRLGTQASQGLR